MKLEDLSGNILTLPVTFRLRERTLSSPVPVQRPAGRDGALRTSRRTREPRFVTLSGAFVGDVQGQLDALAQFIQQGTVKLYDRTGTRFLYAEVENVREALELDSAAVDLSFLARDPFWYGAMLAPVRAVVNPDGWTLAVAGTAHTLPVVTLEPSAQLDSPRLKNLGTQGLIELEGIFAAGSVIEVDVSRATVTVDGVTALDRLSEAAALSTFALYPGDNTLSFTAAGAVTADLTLTYRPRWF